MFSSSISTALFLSAYTRTCEMVIVITELLLGLGLTHRDCEEKQVHTYRRTSAHSYITTHACTRMSTFMFLDNTLNIGAGVVQK